MVKRTLYCDRCGKECEEIRSNRGFHLFRNKYFVATHGEVYLDLCQACYDSLAKWMKEGNNTKA